MNVWSLANWAAWFLSGVIALYLLRDFIRTERSRKD